MRYGRGRWAEVVLVGVLLVPVAGCTRTFGGPVAGSGPPLPPVSVAGPGDGEPLPSGRAVPHDVFIDSNVADFGTQLDRRTHAPRAPGILTFDSDGVVVRPRLRGTLVMRELNGFCARVEVEFFNIRRAVVARHEHPPLCPADDGVWRQDIDWAPFTSPIYVYVRLTVSDRVGSGPWNPGQQRYIYP
jgi:hypothetical protein